MLRTLKNIFNFNRPPKKMESEDFMIYQKHCSSKPVTGIMNVKLKVHILMKYGVSVHNSAQMTAVRNENDTYDFYIKTVDPGWPNDPNASPVKVVTPIKSLRNVQYFKARAILEEFDRTAHAIWTRNFSPTVKSRAELKNHHSASSYRPSGNTN